MRTEVVGSQTPELILLCEGVWVSDVRLRIAFIASWAIALIYGFNVAIKDILDH